jgi:hypothetical protein
VRIVAEGETGHGSLFIDGTAVSKLARNTVLIDGRSCPSSAS